MKVQDIGPAITKRIWIVIALVLVSTLVAAIIAQVQSPVYKVEIAISATAPINRTTGLPDAMTQGAYVALMPSIANFAESIGVAEVVGQRLANEGIEISPEELLKKVSAVPEANSTSMKITFTDGSPTRVADIANTWGEVLLLKTSQTTEFFDQEFKNLLLNGNVVFTNRAVPPEKPTQPKTFAYIGLGFFAGLILGLVLAVFIEYFNPHFRSSRETEETLGLPMLGALPKEKGSRSTALLPSFGKGSRTWEAYSELRSSLIMSPAGTPGSILVVSATPFEAGAAVAANLAVSIANTGRRTLLVDCDLRERTLSRLMEAADRPGLSDVLERNGDWRDKIIESKASDLFLLPSGSKKENSTDLLSLPSFQEELREQEGLYDEVVLYAPPLMGSMDAAVVAAQAEASLVLIDADRCTRKAAQEAMHGFERLGIVPTGVALANVKVKGRERIRTEGEVKPALVETPVKAAPPMEASPQPAPTREEEKASRKEKAAPPAVPYAAAAQPAAQTAEAKAAGQPAEVTPVEQAVEVTQAEQPARTAPAVSPPGGASDELQQVKVSVAEDFRRMGETGAPIPKNWLRALNSDKTDVRESATAAITEYYRSFLHRYRISEESIERITESIIRMMRREGEFASMSEEEAQRHLRQMLVDSGARFSSSPAADSAPTPEQAGTAAAASPDKKDDKDLKRQEKKRFRLDAKSDRRATGRGRGKGSQPQPGDEEGIDWE